MKKGILLPLLMAALAAIVYAMIVRSTENKLTASQKMQSVFVPIKDIKEREVIKGAYLKHVQIPAAYVQKDALTYTTDADLKALENTVARIQFRAVIKFLNMQSPLYLRKRGYPVKFRFLCVV